MDCSVVYCNVMHGKIKGANGRLSTYQANFVSRSIFDDNIQPGTFDNNCTFNQEIPSDQNALSKTIRILVKNDVQSMHPINHCMKFLELTSCCPQRGYKVSSTTQNMGKVLLGSFQILGGE